MPCFRICFPISNCILLFLVLSGAISHYLQTVCKLVYRIVIYIVYAIYVLYFKIFTLFFFVRCVTQSYSLDCVIVANCTQFGNASKGLRSVVLLATLAENIARQNISKCNYC